MVLGVSYSRLHLLKKVDKHDMLCRLFCTVSRGNLVHLDRSVQLECCLESRDTNTILKAYFTCLQLGHISILKASNQKGKHEAYLTIRLYLSIENRSIPAFLMCHYGDLSSSSTVQPTHLCLTYRQRAMSLYKYFRSSLFPSA